ncbi:MAG: PAS domain S-box protein [Hyphomicrobium sp.]
MSSSDSTEQLASAAPQSSEAPAARVSRDLLNAVLAQLEEGVIITDADGRIVFVNEAARQLHGVARLDVTPSDYSATYHLFTEDGQPHPIDDLPLTRAVKYAESVVGRRWRIRKPDGREVLAIGDATPVRDPSGKQIGAVLTIRDDTKRHAVEQNLREAEVHFRSMADNISQLAWMAQADGALFWYNKRWFDYTGAAPEDMMGWGWRAVHHPDHIDRVIAHFRQSIESGEQWEDTFPLRSREGEYRWFLSRAQPIRDEAGDIVLWFGTNTDVTDIREAQDALRLSEARFRGTFENAAVGVAHVSFDGRWLMVNDRLCELLYASRSDLLQLDFDAVTHPDDRLASAEQRNLMREGSLKTYGLDKRLVRSDGSAVWVSETGSLQCDDADTPLYAILVIEDITLRRAAIEHQKFLMRELSHRTKNLLAVIQSIARQTGMNSASTEDFNKRFMPRLAALASSHDLLVNEEWSGVRLDELVREQLKPFLGDDGETRLILKGPQLVVTPTTAQALGLALHELATNAAKYGALSKPGGSLHVGWSFDPNAGDSAFRLTWTERGGPAVAPPDRRGFGHIVVEQVVASSLLGASKLTFEPAGVDWELEAPATCIVTNAKS